MSYREIDAMDRWRALLADVGAFGSDLERPDADLERARADLNARVDAALDEASLAPDEEMLGRLKAASDEMSASVWPIIVGRALRTKTPAEEEAETFLIATVDAQRIEDQPRLIAVRGIAEEMIRKLRRLLSRAVTNSDLEARIERLEWLLSESQRLG
jgi:hypothetical protein